MNLKSSGWILMEFSGNSNDVLNSTESLVFQRSKPGSFIWRTWSVSIRKVPIKLTDSVGSKWGSFLPLRDFKGTTRCALIGWEELGDVSNRPIRAKHQKLQRPPRLWPVRLPEQSRGGQLLWVLIGCWHWRTAFQPIRKKCASSSRRGHKECTELLLFNVLTHNVH